MRAPMEDEFIILDDEATDEDDRALSTGPADDVPTVADPEPDVQPDDDTCTTVHIAPLTGATEPEFQPTAETSLAPVTAPEHPVQEGGDDADDEFEDEEDDELSEAAQAKRMVLRNNAYAEVGVVAGSGLDSVEQLRAKRSRYFLLYFVGLVVVVALNFMCIMATRDRAARVSPTKSYVAAIEQADVNKVTLRATAEMLVMRMHTWSSHELGYVYTSIEPYIHPTELASVHDEFQERYKRVRSERKVSFASPLATSYRGLHPGDVHEVWVLYHLNEGIGHRADQAKFHRSVERLSIIKLAAGAPTDDNLRGIYMVSKVDYDKERWMELSGGKDIWLRTRKQMDWSSREQFQ